MGHCCFTQIRIHPEFTIGELASPPLLGAIGKLGSFLLELMTHCPLANTIMPVEMPSTAHAAATREHKTFQSECVELFADLAHVLGLPRSVGQIYGLLFASSEPLSFSDFVERLEISKGSASQGLQLLRNIGAIRPVSTGSDRSDEHSVGKSRDYYEPELSLRKLVSGVLQGRIVPMTMTGSDHFTRLRLLAEKADKQNGFLVERVEQLETWRKRFRRVLPILSTLFGPKKQ